MNRTLKIEGMSCQNCVAHVQKALSSLPGVRSVAVDLASGSAQIETDTDADPGFAATLEEEGYQLVGIQ